MANGVFQLYFIEVAYPFYRSDSHQIIDLGSLDLMVIQKKIVP